MPRDLFSELGFDPAPRDLLAETKPAKAPVSKDRPLPQVSTSGIVLGNEPSTTVRDLRRGARAMERPQERNIVEGTEPTLNAPVDTWADTGRKFTQRAVPLLQKTVGGLAESFAENGMLEQFPTTGAELESMTPQARETMLNRLRETQRIPGQALTAAATEDLAANGYAPGSYAQHLAGSFADSMLLMLPTIAATVATRSPRVGQIAMGASVGGDQYGDSRAMGRSTGAALVDSVFMGAAEMIGERTPLGMVMQPGGKFFPKVFKVAGAEGIQETITGVLQVGYDKGVLHPDMTWGEAVQQVIDSGLVGAMMGGTMGAGSAVLARGAEDRARRNDAEIDAAAVQAMDPNGNSPAEQRQYTLPLTGRTSASAAASTPIVPSTRPPGTSPAEEAVQALDPNGYNPADRRGAAPPLGTLPRPPGIVERAATEAARLTPEDEASPIPNDVIAQGRAELARATAAPEASAVLEAQGLPAIGSVVSVSRGERTARGRIVDVFETDAGEAGSAQGVKVALDDGTLLEEHFDTLRDLGVRIAPFDPADAPGVDPADLTELPAERPTSAAAPDPAPSPVREAVLPRGNRPASAPTPVSRGGIPGYMAKNRRVESGGNDAAKNSRSSATGRYQFTDGTWLSTHRKVFGDTGESDAQILAKRSDGAIQDRLMQRLTQDNSNGLRSAGVPATDGNRYLAHFLGLGGALKVLTARASTPIEQAVGEKVVAANPFLKGKTTRDVIRWAANKMGEASPIMGDVAQNTIPTDEDTAPVEFVDMDWGDDAGEIGNNSPSVEADAGNDLGNDTPASPPVGDSTRAAPVQATTVENLEVSAAQTAQPADEQEGTSAGRADDVRRQGLGTSATTDPKSGVDIPSAVAADEQTVDPIEAIRSVSDDVIAPITAVIAETPWSDTMTKVIPMTDEERDALNAAGLTIGRDNEISTTDLQLLDDERARRIKARDEVAGQTTPRSAGTALPKAAPPATAPAVRYLARDDGRYAVATAAVLTSKSGRSLAPAPRFDDSTKTKLNLSLSRQRAWLINEAIKESEVGRGNLGNYARSTLLRMRENPSNMSGSDWSILNDVLFGNDRGPSEMRISPTLPGGMPIEEAAAAARRVRPARPATPPAVAEEDRGSTGEPSARDETVEAPAPQRAEPDSGASASNGPAGSSPAPSATSAYGSKNRLVSTDRAEELRRRLKAKMQQMQSGVDPEALAIGVELAIFHIEAGARKFVDFVRAIESDIRAMGEDPARMRSYLRGWYNGARDTMEDQGEDVSDLDGPGAVRAAFSMLADTAAAPATPAPEPATEVADATDAEPARAGTDDRDGDAGQRADDAPSAVSERGSESGAAEPGARGERELRGSDQPGGEPVSRTDGPVAGKRERAPRRGRDGDRASGRVPARGSRSGAADYLAPAGSLRRQGSWRATAARNLDIIELVGRLDAEGRPATPEEQALLAQFTGWGAAEIRNNLFRNVAREADGARRIVPTTWGEWAELSKRAARLLTGEQLETALQSTQYAHYTPEPVIRSMWVALERMGFKGGAIVEPGMGIGLFAAAAPASLMSASRYTGIELDAFSAKIAGYLLPNQAVRNGDFTREKLPNGFFDAAIGNPPFAQVQVTDDPAYRRQRFSLHDYFFAKTIDKVRPGGLLAFVTSRYTMDKQDAKAREYIAERADLIGAIRLPATAFKENAGAEVVTDILFLQRRAPGTERAGADWLSLDAVSGGQANGSVINQYFVANPEMVLGRHATASSQFRRNDYTVEADGTDLASQLDRAVARLPKNIMRDAPSAGAIEQRVVSVQRDMRPSAEKEGAIYLGQDGALFLRDNGVGVPLAEAEKVSAADQAWLKGYVGLRDAVKRAQADQLADGEWQSSLKALNRTYDAFVKAHGQVSAFTTYERKTTDEDGNETVTQYRRFKNQRLLEMDVEGTLVSALERIGDDGTIGKSPFLLDRTLKKPTRPKIESARDALAVALDEVGKLDLGHVASLLGRPVDSVIAELGDAIWQTPTGEYQTTDEYLSGDVVAKLEEARIAADNDPRFERNVEALWKVQPKPLAYADIAVKLGAGWIPTDVVARFAEEVLEENVEGITYEAAVALWRVPNANRRSTRGASNEFGTEDRSPLELLDALLNSRSVKIVRTERVDGSTKTWTDQEATALANERAQKISDRFKTWIWTDAQRAARLSAIYNRQFNNLAPRRFDGSHLTLPGLSTRYSLYDHQKRAIWRVIATGNTYLNHAVGAGKTLEMIVAGMEQRRLGLIRKPMYVVPNHMLNQFAREFLDAYPAANIMVADEKQFHTDNRRRFMAQAALNDPDAIIVSHSGFGRIGTSPETRDSVVQRFVEEMEAAQESLDSTDRIGRRKIEQQIEQMKRRFAGRASDEKKDRALTFEEMGVDFLFVDEAHEFRKLDFSTNRASVKGIDPNGSQKALDLYIKLRWLNRQRPGRAGVLASGTPVTNTMAELYTSMRYLDEDALERDGLRAFDAWSAMFGEVAAGFEQNAAGGYEMVERYARFVNVPELMKRVRTFMDVLTSEQLGDLVKRPTVKGGVPENVVVPASDALDTYMKVDLQERIKVSRAWKPSRAQPGNPDPIINIITDGRLSAIDMRFVDPSAPNDPNSKLNRMIDRIIEKHREFARVEFTNPVSGGKEARRGATQIVFSAVGFGDQVAASRGFDARAWVDQRLKDAGIPATAVAWMGDQNTHAKKEAAFKDMRAGVKRLLLGSPKNMGTGVNVQSRLKVLHYLSPPWYPSDVEQPHGRIIRQGNLNSEVELYWYATKGTYDSTAWSMVSRKQRFIEQAMRGDDTIRSIEDVSEANQYEMASALAAGDERAIQLAGLSSDIERLTKLRAAHQQEQGQLAFDQRSMQRQVEREGPERERLVEAVAAKGEGYRPFAMTVDGATYDKPGEAGRALIGKVDAALAAFKGAGEERTEIGRYLGTLPVSVAIDDRETGFGKDRGTARLFSLFVKAGPLDLEVVEDRKSTDGLDATGFAQRVQNAVNRLPTELENFDARSRERQGRLRAVDRKLGASFEYEAELAEKVAERARLQEELSSETKARQEATAPKQSVVEGEPAPVAVLRGDELGMRFTGPVDFLPLRDAAIAYYRRELLGSTVTMADGVEVTFNGRGLRESIHGRGDLLLRMVPAIKDVLARGTIVERVPGNRPDIVEVLTVQAPVELEGEVYKVRLTVRDHSDQRRRQYSLLLLSKVPESRSSLTEGAASETLGDPDEKSLSGRLNIDIVGDDFNDPPGDRAERVRADLDARLRQLNMSDATRLRIVDALAPSVAGEYNQRVITVALASTQDPRFTLDHEVIHALRDPTGPGLFLEAEWRALTARARANAALMESVRRRYPALSVEAQLEEAVADMFARWSNGSEERGFIARAFERVRDVLRAFGEALRGNGFTTAQSVMRRIDQGDLGSRAARVDALEQASEPKQSIVTDADTAHSFGSEETERRWAAAAEGLGSGDSMLLRLKAGLSNIANGFARHWEALPNEPRYSGLQQKLRALEAAPQAAKERAIRMLSDLVQGFSRADLDLFARKVVLDDLIWEADQEHELPFGLTPETLREEKRRVDAIVQAQSDKRVWKAAMRRKLVNRKVADDLVAAGVLEADRVKNPAYFRHQVLDYARTEARLARGGARKLKSPRWAKRMGSSLDINANLLEAEFDWLNKALTDIPTARTIDWIKRSEHNLLPDLQQRARDNNAERLRELIAEENDPDGEVTAAERDFRQRIARGFQFIRERIEDGDVDNVPRQFEAAADAIVSGTPGENTFPFLSWILDNNEAASMGAAMILKAIGQRRSFRQRVIGDRYIDPSDADALVKRLAPEGYTTWSPDEGKLLFTVKTLPEHVIDGMIAKIDAAPAGVDPTEFRAALEKARTALALGGDRYKMILPEEVAATLNRLRREDVEGIIGEALAVPVRAWKRWVLINPRRVIKYNLNNLSGDLDAVLAGNPRLLRRTPTAARELASVMRGKSPPSARYLEAVERGVFDSGLSIQEIPEINRLSAFAALTQPESKRPDKLAVAAIGKAWRGLQGFTQWRESVFRYAAYLDYAERLEAGEDMAAIGYGASVPDMVDAIDDVADKAALLARDLVGDYGAVSENGQWMRAHLVPFWSWMEINTKRYWRLTSNAYTQGLGRGVATGGALAVAAGARGTAWLVIRMMMVYGAINLWNWLLFNDEEDELSEEQRRQLHIILGRNGAGEVVTLRTQGAFSDALGWFGLGDAAEAIKNVEQGRGTVGDVAAAPFKATINRVGTSLSPALTIPVEAATGKKLWPDLFATRVNRDPWRNLFSSFSLENEYDAARDLPSRGYGRSWVDSIVYRRQPGEIAYDEARGLAYDWLRREKGQEGSSSFSTPRSEAARRYRTALRYGDESAAEKALDDMGEFGTSQKDLDGMLKRAEPLGPIPKKDRRAFLDQLTDEELVKFERAQEWYETTFR